MGDSVSILLLHELGILLLVLDLLPVPLDPTAVVYTTAQKVADLLDIGPQEAVLMPANAEANAVFVTGSDYRNIGFRR